MVLGENGSGKTTLIKSMLQQLPYTGDILYQHQHISHMQEKERAKIFSYVPQIKELANGYACRGLYRGRMFTSFINFWRFHQMPNTNR